MPKKSVDVESRSVTFDFGEENGQVAISLSDLPEAIVTQLALHGLSQKGGDSYAGAKQATAELDIGPEEWAKAQVESVAAQLVAGEWSVRREGGGGGVTDLAKAIAEALGEDIQAVVKQLEDADKETKASLRKHPEVAAILARLRQERAEAKAKAAAEAAGAHDGPSLAEALAG